MPDMIQEIEQRLSSGKVERQHWEPVWQKVMELFDPNYSDVYDKNRKGSERGDLRIYDSKGVRGLEVFVAGVHHKLFTPFTQFLEYTVKDRRLLSGNKALKKWLADVSDVVSDGIIASNFHAEIEPGIRSLGTFGHYTQWVDTYPIDHDMYGEYIFTDLPADQVYLFEGINGIVESIIREYHLNSTQIKNNPEFFMFIMEDKEFARDLESDPDKLWHICQYVTPARKDMQMINQQNEYADIKVLLGKNKVCNAVGGRYRGYGEKPFYTNRFAKRTGQVYSRSLAMSVLGENESLQQLAYWRLKAAGLATSPPVKIRRNNVTDDIKILPDSEIDVKHPDDVSYLESRSRMDVASLETESIVRNIDMAYHVEDFIFPKDAKTMSATEASIRSESQQGQHSPMLSRLYFDHISPMANRLFWIKYRAKQIEAPPVNLSPKDLSVKIISPMAQAQNSMEILRAENFMRSLMEFSQQFPRIAAKISEDDYVNFVADRSNKAFFEFLRSDDEVAELEQQQAMRSSMLESSEAMKNVALAQNANARTERLQAGG